MKSSIVETKKAGVPFPKLMINADTGTVVLFERSGKGVIVHSKNSFSKVGVSSSAWTMARFQDFNGALKLSNK